MTKGVLWLLSLSLALIAAGTALSAWEDRIPLVREIAEEPHARAVVGLTTLRTTGLLAPGDVGFKELTEAFVERHHGSDTEHAVPYIVGLAWRRASYESESYVAPSYAYPIVATFSNGAQSVMVPGDMVLYVDRLSGQLDGLWAFLTFLGGALGVVGWRMNRRWEREHPTEVAPRERQRPPWRR